MIRKIVNKTISVVVLLLTPLICLSGDIPEGLLMNDTSEVYFGEIKSVNEDSITVIQTKPIMGTFEEGSERIYSDFVFSQNPIVGTIYLCGFYDAYNPLYVWEVTSLDPKTLQIKTTDNMSLRMQEYLNKGAFEEREKERLAAVQPTVSIDTINISDKLNKEEQEQTKKSIKVDINRTLVGYTCGIIILGGFLIWQKRRDTEKNE